MVRGGQDYVPGKAFDRFVTIWLENQDFSAVSQNSDIRSLAKSGILLTSFYGLTHPSQPNYIASVGGDYFGLNHDDVVRLPTNVSTVVDLFDTKGISWKEYMEDVPGPGYMGVISLNDEGETDYVRKHKYGLPTVFRGPLISFDSVANNGTRLANIVSFNEFEVDLRDKTLPQYSHLTPNMTNDGHDTSLSFAATWTKNFLTPLLEDPSFTNRTLILLTYDESKTYTKPNKIVSILLGDAVPKNLRGTKDDTFYTHYSILSTLENNFALPNLGRYDVGANVFDVVAKTTGHQNNNSAVDKSKVDLSVSYRGYLNSKASDRLPIPYPNTLLLGAGGPVLDDIKRAWGVGQKTPYDGSGRVFDKGHPPIYGDMVQNTPAPAATVVPKSSGGGRREGSYGVIVCAAVMGVLSVF
ncbi:hypothetical protein FGG08_001335 [Glutinoglossum americanum]|uniref:Acid phosphatase n=1 Tax=Glutinoglossum americanum TaxID=1670608 RepID=A0A9P8IBS6_9PEZI|nr:hypothetical protein FGG08_001335 [Glutinoglossum americanum]